MMMKELFVRISGLPLHRRRTLLRGAWECAGLIGSRGDLAPLQRTFETVMRFPTKEATKLAYEAAFQNVLVMLEWLQIKTRGLDALLAEDSPYVTFENEEPLVRLASEGRSLILAPLHTGAYMLSLAYIMQRHFQGRRVLVVMNHVENEEMVGTIQRLSEVGCEVRIMGIRDKAGYIDALRFARRDAIIVCFCDLPGAYGAPFDTELFGRPIRLAMGIDLFARACGAAVVPMAFNSYLRREAVTIRQPFEVADESAAERARVGTLIRHHIEMTIRNEPAHWHLWPRFDEFLALREAA